MPFNSQLFSKLSHQMEGLLKKLPRVDKFGVSCLLEFLVDVIKTHNVHPLPDIQFSNLISLYNLNSLAAKLGSTIKGGWTFQHFHCDVLEYLGP